MVGSWQSPVSRKTASNCSPAALRLSTTGHHAVPTQKAAKALTRQRLAATSCALSCCASDDSSDGGGLRSARSRHAHASAVPTTMPAALPAPVANA